MVSGNAASPPPKHDFPIHDLAFWDTADEPRAGTEVPFPYHTATVSAAKIFSTTAS